MVCCLVSRSFVVHGEILVIMRQILAGQLFIFNKHKTSQCVETFVITMLHCSKSNGRLNLKLEERYNHLSSSSYEHTQIMIPTFTFREKKFYVPNLIHKSNLQKITTLAQKHSQFVTNLPHKLEKQINYLQLALLLLNFYLLCQFKIPKKTIYDLLKLGPMLCNYLKQNQNPK